MTAQRSKRCQLHCRGTTARSARRPAGLLSYSETYRASPIKREAPIHKSISAATTKHILNDFRIPFSTSCIALDLSKSTVNRKAAAAAALPADVTKRVLGVTRLIGQVESIVQKSGEPEGFDAVSWLSEWLARSCRPSAAPGLSS